MRCSDLKCPNTCSTAALPTGTSGSKLTPDEIETTYLFTFEEAHS